MNLLSGSRTMTPYEQQFLRDRLRGKSYLQLAYFEGATPQNGYQPTVPYVLNVLADSRPQDMEPGYLRVFQKTAGADSPRPIKLRQGFDRRMVPLGIFQYFKRHPHSDSGRHMGVTNIRKEVHKYGTY